MPPPKDENCTCFFCKPHLYKHHRLNPHPWSIEPGQEDCYALATQAVAPFKGSVAPQSLQTDVLERARKMLANLKSYLVALEIDPKHVLPIDTPAEALPSSSKA